MKKLSIMAFCLFLGLQVMAQNPKHYLGTYTVANGPIDKILVTWENEKLYGQAVGQGKAELKTTKVADTFEVIGYEGEVKFERNDQKIVQSLLLSISGQEISANRLVPPLSDFVGNYIFADGPISSMELTVENGEVLVDIPEVGKGPILETSIIDQFYGETYNSDIVFSRNEKNEVDSVHISAQGMIILGAKEIKNAVLPNPFVGFYEFDSSEISELEIISKDEGNLYGKSDQGEGLLQKTEKQDVFKIPEYDGEAVFERGIDGLVKGVVLKIQGEQMKGTKRK